MRETQASKLSRAEVPVDVGYDFLPKIEEFALEAQERWTDIAEHVMASLAAMALASWSTVSGETKRILVAFFGFLTGDEPKVRISNRAGFC